MGFEVKIVFVLPETTSADQVGFGGESTCVLWRDSRWGLDFGHITRLEKLTHERFRHIHDSFSPFERAGICTTHLFCSLCLFVDFEQRIEERCAPEILIPKPFWREQRAREETVKIGGHVYLDVSESRLKGRMGNETLVENHNRGVHRPTTLKSLLEQGWRSMMDPPLLWASCSELADCLIRAELEQIEAWKTIQRNPISDAFVCSWRESLRRLGAVGARAVFRFS